MSILIHLKNFVPLLLPGRATICEPFHDQDFSALPQVTHMISTAREECSASDQQVVLSGHQALVSMSSM